MTNTILNHFPSYVVKHATDLCGQLFSKTCCTKFIHNLDVTDEKCLALFATKLLGYGIVVGASAVKLPQVFKILGAKSGVGITIFGVLLELMAITFNACYSFRNNFPFSAWGEAIFLGLETALIAFLVLWYNGNKQQSTIFLLAFSAIVYTLLNPTLVSKEILWWLQSTVLPLAVSGKLMQAFKNYQAQHTGQLSALTAWAILLGSITRIFTTIQETGDVLTATTFAFAAGANAVIALQVLYYWKKTQQFIEKGKKKKAN